MFVILEKLNYILRSINIHRYYYNTMRGESERKVRWREKGKRGGGEGGEREREKKRQRGGEEDDKK